MTRDELKELARDPATLRQAYVDAYFEIIDQAIEQEMEVNDSLPTQVKYSNAVTAASAAVLMSWIRLCLLDDTGGDSVRHLRSTFRDVNNP